MTSQKNPMCTSFAGSRMIASGNLFDVAMQTKLCLDAGEKDTILVFDDETSKVIEIDFRGEIESFKNRLNQQSISTQPITVNTGGSTGDNTDGSARGRGRPKLGVVSREVTLLPRHWEWLNQQPGGASVALRKLVEEAKRANTYKDERRVAQDSTYRFMSAMAGNLAGFEEATRALFASNRSRFDEQIESWSADVVAHVKKISQKAFS